MSARNDNDREVRGLSGKLTIWLISVCWAGLIAVISFIATGQRTDGVVIRSLERQVAILETLVKSHEAERSRGRRFTFEEYVEFRKEIFNQIEKIEKRLRAEKERNS